MGNPVLTEVLRGPLVESRHRGSAVVVDAAGDVVLALGDVEHPVFPRSATKPFQALPFVESGAFDAYGFKPEHLAFAMASHSGEDRHVGTARVMLERAGLGETCLACGAHWPMGVEASRELARRGGEPTRLHNNCSGKHAGFLCTAVHQGLVPEGYEKPDHPLMKQVIAASEALTGAPHLEENMGRDGCSIPTYAIPLVALARGYSRFVTGRGLGTERAKAAKRIVEAVSANPFMVAGTGRFCTQVMQAFPGKVFAKTGAEGVFGAALPQSGFALAVKIDDGGTRASEMVTAALIEALLGVQGDPVLERYSAAPINSWAGESAGALRASSGFVEALKVLPRL